MTDSKIKVNANRQDYLTKLDSMENEILSLKNTPTGASATSDILASTEKEYKTCDKELNDIYSLLKQQLPTDEMNKLEKEETEWNKLKEARANAAEKEIEQQGPKSQWGNVANQASIVDSTQSRCYELVYGYMK